MEKYNENIINLAFFIHLRFLGIPKLKFLPYNGWRLSDHGATWSQKMFSPQKILGEKENKGENERKDVKDFSKSVKSKRGHHLR